MDEWRRSGQIPAFGDWEKANEMPITQYFESARQAGLIRHTSSGDCDQYMQQPQPQPGPARDHFKKTSQDLGPAHRKMNRGRRMSSHGKEQQQKKQGKVYDVTEPTTRMINQQIIMSNNNNNNRVNVVHKFPKPVDEDLYKIPPHLIRNSKRNKLPGFFSCLVPGCAS